jgi:hypothetical protein
MVLVQLQVDLTPYICNPKMNIVRIRGMSKIYCLSSKVNTLNGRRQTNLDVSLLGLPQGQDPRFFHGWLKISIYSNTHHIFHSYDWMDHHGRVHWKSSF